MLQIVVNVEFRIHEYLVGCAAASVSQSAHTCYVCREMCVVKSSTDCHTRYWSTAREGLYMVDIFGTEITRTSITTPHRSWHWILLTARNPQAFTTCGGHCCLHLSYMLMSVLLPRISLNYFGEVCIELRHVKTYFYLCVTEKCFQWLMMDTE